MRNKIIKTILVIVLYINLSYVGQWLFRSTVPMIFWLYALIVLICTIKFLPKRIFKNKEK